MSDVTLLAMPETQDGAGQFVFEHAMAHRAAQGTLSVFPGLPTFSTMPYFIAPRPGPYGRGFVPTGQLAPLYENDGKYFQIHQQAQSDMLDNLPSQTVVDASGQWWTEVPIGIPSLHDLQDMDLDDEAQRRWWTFANHMEHMSVGYSIHPIIVWIFPFW